MGDYNPQAIETKWQKSWEENHVFESEVNPQKTKILCAGDAAVPIGDAAHGTHAELHDWGCGGAREEHARVQRAASDGVGRVWTASGKRSDQEQYASAGVDQQKHCGIPESAAAVWVFSYDWRREISTCEPEYYRWNQWFFLKMLERGIAYKKKSRVNWCPKCCTVLANEQVVNGGYCWRHEDTLVEAREIEQWFLKMTEYAEQLLDDLKTLEGGWPDRVIAMQENWIGKSIGAKVLVAVAEAGRKPHP